MGVGVRVWTWVGVLASPRPSAFGVDGIQQAFYEPLLLSENVLAVRRRLRVDEAQELSEPPLRIIDVHVAGVVLVGGVDLVVARGECGWRNVFCDGAARRLQFPLVVFFGRHAFLDRRLLWFLLTVTCGDQGVDS